MVRSPLSAFREVQHIGLTHASSSAFSVLVSPNGNSGYLLGSLYCQPILTCQAQCKRAWSPTSSLPPFSELGATVGVGTVFPVSSPGSEATGNTSWAVTFSCFASSSVKGSRDGTFRQFQLYSSALVHPLGVALSGHQRSLVSWSAVFFVCFFNISFLPFFWERLTHSVADVLEDHPDLGLALLSATLFVPPKHL